MIAYDLITYLATIYVSNGGTVLSEYTEYGVNVPTWTKSYVYLGDSMLSTITPNGTGGESTEFNHPDRLGTRTITNQATGSSYEQTTLPFGTALNAESTTSTNKRFTSYDRSARTGLDYAVNRTYDSKQGRFTQVDPIGMGAANLASPQTLNLYAYCGNDPINYTDPSGLFWGFFKKLFKWVLVAVAVIVAVVTIVGVLAAPATIAGILSAISAGASAASQVLNAFGFRRAGLILGIIAVVAGFGSVIAGKMGNSYVSGDSRGDQGWSGVLSGVGAVANSLQAKGKKTLDVCNHYLKTYYSLLKPYFDKLWEKTQNSKSEEAPNGKEQGGVIYISNSKVSIGGIEENGLDEYNGKTYKGWYG